MEIPFFSLQFEQHRYKVGPQELAPNLYFLNVAIQLICLEEAFLPKYYTHCWNRICCEVPSKSLGVKSIYRFNRRCNIIELLFWQIVIRTLQSDQCMVQKLAHHFGKNRTDISAAFCISVWIMTPTPRDFFSGEKLTDFGPRPSLRTDSVKERVLKPSLCSSVFLSVPSILQSWFVVLALLVAVPEV